MGTRKFLICFLAMLVGVALCNAGYAQENKILMTTSQQYQNLVPNASFEAWDTANTKPADWTKIDAPTLVQSGAIKKIGGYGLSVSSAQGTTSQGISYTIAVEPKTAYTVSFYYYSAVANQAEAEVDGNVTANLVDKTAGNAFASTGAAWKRYAATFTTGTDTSVTIKLYAMADAGGVKTAYFDGVMLTEGHATPAFNTHAIADTGDQVMYGGLTVTGDTVLKGNVQLGDIGTDNITLTGTLKSPDSLNVAITPGSGGKTVITGDADVTGNLDVTGTIQAGSGNNQITTAEGLLDATKVTGTLPGTTYSAYDDLVTEAKISNGSTIVTSSNYSSYGDITGVTASTGLTGGGDSGSVTLSIANGGVTATQLNASVAGDGLTGGGGTALAVGAGTGMSVSADAIGIANLGVDSAQLATGAVLRAKLNELRPHTHTSTDAIYVEAGTVIIANNEPVDFAGGATAAFDPVLTGGNSRIDLVVMDSTPALSIVKGTEAVSPAAPAAPSDKLVIAKVTVTETGTAVIGAGDIADVRPFLSLGGGSGMSAITGTTSESFIIGDNPNGDKTLAFETGVTDETLVWNDAQGRFDLSDSINIPTGENYMINGSQIASTNLSDTANIGMLNQAETVTGGWTFNTAATTFTTAIDVNSASTIAGLNIDSGTLQVGGTTVIDASRNISNIGTVSSTGNYTLDGDLAFTGPQAITTSSGNLTLNPTGTISASSKGIASVGGLSGVTTIDASGKATFTHTGTLDAAQALDINSTGIMTGTDNKTIASISDAAAHTTSGNIKGLELTMEGAYNNASADPTALSINLTGITGTAGVEKGIDIQMGAATDAAINTNAKIVAASFSGTTITDGTLSITGGDITSVDNITAASIDVTSMTVGGGYGSTGISMDTNGNISIDGNIIQKSGQKYMSDATNFTGDYGVGMTLKVGIGADGLDADYLLIGDTGTISHSTGAVTINDALTQSGSGNQVSLAGNVDATNGLDVTGAALTAASGLTVSAGNVAFSTTGTINQSGTGQVTFSGNVNAVNGLDVTTADLTVGGANFTVAPATGNTTVGGTLGVTGTTTLSGTLNANGQIALGDSGDTVAISSSDWGITTTGNMTGIGSVTMDGNLTASNSLLNIDKSYTNQAGAVTDHVVTRTTVLDDGTSKAISGNIFTIDAVNTQTSGTLTDNSTLLHLKTGANAGAGGYFIYAEDNTGSVKFSLDNAGNLSTAGTQTITGGTQYDGHLMVDYTDPEALIVRKDADAGDVFIVDSTNSQVEIYNQLGIGKTPQAGVELDVSGDAALSGILTINGGTASDLDVSGGIYAGTGNAFQVSTAGAVTSVGLNAGSGAITTSNNISTTGSGAITAANGLTVSAGGAGITGNSTVTGSLGVSGANNFTVNTNKFTVDGATGNTISAGTLRSLSSVGLIPEYDNATPQGDGTDNFGTLNLKYANSHNYYEWTTSEPTTQDYDIVVRYRLPDGFSSFDATAPIKLWNKVSSAPGNTAIDVTMLDTTGAAVTINNGATLQNTSWTENTMTIGGSPTFTAGGYVTIIITISADQGKLADVGELTLKGNW